ncbi:MAG: DUF4920 domain-containing protein [Acidobacteria bacterium]|nr:DUF4920 domain-containing protein [Acidobacteriota bacterium]
MKPVASLLLAIMMPAAELKLGKPLAGKEALSVSAVLAKPEPYTGRTLQVKGRVTEVCQRMGCWMSLVDPVTNQSLRIQVNDGEIRFPRDAPGKMAIAEGKLMKLELSRRQAADRARHEAEEQGRTFDPAAVKKGAVLYHIQATGAVLQQ